MTKKEKLQEEYKLRFGIEPNDDLTIKELESALDELPAKEAKPKRGKVFITNGKISKSVNPAQWKNMQQFKHDWKEVINEPLEVQKLKENGKNKE